MAEIKFTVDENALQVFSNTEIKANFTEVKAALEEMVKPYKGVIVDPSNLSETKADIARIRKIERNIDSYRKMVKKYALAPLTAFEDKCKELSAVCTDAVSAMDGQVKEIERRQKDEKIDSLRLYFDLQEKRYPDFVSFDEVFNERWENKTYEVQKCQEEILEYLGQVEKDIDIIKSLNSEEEVALLMRYSEYKDLRDVMNYNASLVRQKQKAEEERKAAEERKRQQEEAERLRAEQEKQWEEEQKNLEMLQGIEAIPARPEPMDLPFGMPEEVKPIPTKVVEFSFKVEGTPAEIARFEELLLSWGITNYRMIEQ